MTHTHHIPTCKQSFQWAPPAAPTGVFRGQPLRQKEKSWDDPSGRERKEINVSEKTAFSNKVSFKRALTSVCCLAVFPRQSMSVWNCQPVQHSIQSCNRTPASRGRKLACHRWYVFFKGALFPIQSKCQQIENESRSDAAVVVHTSVCLCVCECVWGCVSVCVYVCEGVCVCRYVLHKIMESAAKQRTPASISVNHLTGTQVCGSFWSVYLDMMAVHVSVQRGGSRSVRLAMTLVLHRPWLPKIRNI